METKTEFEFRTSGTDKIFKVKGNTCVFDNYGGIQYIAINLKQIVLNEGFEPIVKTGGYIDIVRSV